LAPRKIVSRIPENPFTQWSIKQERQRPLKPIRTAYEVESQPFQNPYSHPTPENAFQHPQPWMTMNPIRLDHLIPDTKYQSLHLSPHIPRQKSVQKGLHILLDRRRLTSKIHTWRVPIYLTPTFFFFQSKIYEK
jgi:hypothetical protein